MAVLFKDGGLGASPKFYLFVFGINQANGGAGFACLTPELERFFLDLLRVVKKYREYALEVECWGVLRLRVHGISNPRLI